MLSTDRTVERAFALAREGMCHSIHDIRRNLKTEGFSNVDAHLGGATIKKQLSALIKARGEVLVPGSS